MKKSFMIISFLITFVIILVSCSDDPVKPPVTDTSNKYYPTNDSSWWVYKSYELDDNGNPNEATIFYMKKNVGGTEEKDGKDASIYQIQDTNGAKIGNNEYYYTSNTQIYSYYKKISIAS